MDTNKDAEENPFDVDIQACSTMDCTGLIPSLSQDGAERESYEDLYPYIAKAQKVGGDAKG